MSNKKRPHRKPAVKQSPEEVIAFYAGESTGG